MKFVNSCAFAEIYLLKCLKDLRVLEVFVQTVCYINAYITFGLNEGGLLVWGDGVLVIDRDVHFDKEDKIWAIFVEYPKHFVDILNTWTENWKVQRFSQLSSVRISRKC